jgi:hypothetical protein
MPQTFFLTECPGLQTAVQASDTIGNTTTATFFGSSWTIPASGLNRVGRRIRTMAWGVYSTDAVLGHAITLELIAGTTSLASTGSVSLTLGGASNKGWMMVADIACRTTGTSGTLEAQGLTLFGGSALTPDAAFMTNTATVQIDLTQSLPLAIRATWGTATASNAITMRLKGDEIMGTS